MLNLLKDPWLPIIRRHTGRCVIHPAKITEFHDQDPVIAIDWPRPDFCIATLELLTGLLATIIPPQDGDDWLGRWREPPSPAELDEAFAPFVHAFSLDGNGPRFLQDLEDLDSNAEPIERLLIEAPGAATTSKNTDLMVHRGRIATLARAAAAIALYTFQSWAPAGGAGNRTGLRGGGPLVTMVIPGATPTLWQTLWANVPTGGAAPARYELPLVFPWLAPTVISEGTKVVTPQTAHRLQCWWGMPRRIRLDFTAFETPRHCDLTGIADRVHAISWRQRPRGANYAAWGGIHPLTPHYQLKSDSEKLAVHPQPDGIGYRHWIGLVLASKDGMREPASAVADWHNRRGMDAGGSTARLIAAGFDMDNMKARGFVETELPLPTTQNRDAQCRVNALAYDFVMAADLVATLLRSAVRNALFSSGASVKFDAVLFNTVRERLWDETETHFSAKLEAAAQCTEGGSDTDRVGWLKHLRQIALELFEEAAPLSAESGSAAAPRIAKARRFLGSALAGYGPAGTALFTILNLPTVESNETRKRRKAG